MSRARTHLTYANVMASIAVFIALGGGAWAATKLVGSDGVVHACVSKHGKLTVVKAGRRCVRGKQAVAINQRGPAGPATGAAGGDLTGNYPNPAIGDGRVSASKLAPLDNWTLADLSTLPQSSCGPSSRYQPYGSGYALPAFRRDAYGVVHLRGAVGCAPNTGSPPAPEFIFTLPEGYRPLEKEAFASASASNPTSYTTYTHGAIEVDPDGRVYVAGGSQKFYSFSGIEFDTLH